ncbi:hypothetical protein, partial [Escherichia coli]|uniref:hypothetical protein n=1 Tax=Escherichia coli TaxID=562 RepID=UPI001953625D
ATRSSIALAMGSGTVVKQLEEHLQDPGGRRRAAQLRREHPQEHSAVYAGAAGGRRDTGHPRVSD